MNREIKFRAWDKSWKRMFDNDIMVTSGHELVRFAKRMKPNFPGLSDAHGGLLLPTDDENMIFMQFTGIKDKNGIDVYEGDIYRNLDNGLIGKLQILVGVGGLYVICTEYKDGRIYNNHPFAEHDTTNFEVIGNIYENPELIEGETA